MLISTYWRYFSFRPDGTLSYALLSESPSYAEMMFRNRSERIADGTYVINRWEVLATVALPYATVTFRMKLADGDYGGKFTRLEPIEHCSMSKNERYPTWHRINSDHKFYFRFAELRPSSKLAS
jgi:hypothetical protein